MASVQLSERLRGDIANNFKIQLGKAYRKSYNVDESLSAVINHLENDSEYLQELISLEKSYQRLLPDLENKYRLGQLGYYGSKLKENVLPANNEIGIVCNPNRPIEHNLTFLKEWCTPYKDAYSDESHKGREYVEGDVAVKIENLEYYYPHHVRLDYTRGWRGEGQYAPHSNNYVVLITDPAMCKAFSPIGEIEDRIAQETQVFVDSLSKKNTLKQFLDDWPAGKSLVPEDDILRMTTVKKRTSTTKAVVDTIPDELKDSMNEVLLGNKLLGDD
jgi:hypothetical protein